jgi:glycosyltransferase involved in cell wall biosynthesis
MPATPSVLMMAPGDHIHSMRPLKSLLSKGWFVHFADSLNPFPKGMDRFAFHPYPLPRGERTLSKLFGKRTGAEISAWTSIPRVKNLWQKARRPVTHIHWVDRRAYYAAKAGIRPLILTVWGSDINNCLNGDVDPVVLHQVGAGLRAADLVIIDSADMHQKCAELAGKSVPTQLLTLGVDTQKFHPRCKEQAIEWRQALKISAEACILVSMRGWSPLYRQESIIRAFAQAVPSLGRPAVLVLKTLRRPGADCAAYQKELELLVEQLGIAPHVRWLNEVPFERLPEIYCLADAILNYPSKDAFPVTFLEAAACETPVISCSQAAYSGTFAEKYFELFPDADSTSLASAICRFVTGQSTQSSERRSELRALVCREHDERAVADRLVAIYNRFDV